MGYNRIDSIFCRSQVFFFQFFFLYQSYQLKQEFGPFPVYLKCHFFHFENVRLLVHLFFVVVGVGVGVGVGGRRERELQCSHKLLANNKLFPDPISILIICSLF